MAEKPHWEGFVQRKPRPFKPVPFYDPVDDSLTLYITDDESYSDPVSRGFTVYQTRSGQVTGFKLSGIQQLLSLLVDFGVDASKQPITIGMLFLPLIWADSSPFRAITLIDYRDILRPILAVASKMVVKGLCP